ncbi:MAG TPA: VWA domain-containing protein [Bryobacteraceae bacterium]|nr:VWA domain-containing protein [Bryobacteraceae bacterium]
MSKLFTPAICIALFFWGAAAVRAADDSNGPNFLEQHQRLQPTHPAAGIDIRVDANMTLVPVTVTDDLGRNVRGLRKQNFRVFDGAEPRPIVSFSQQDAPVSVGLVFDCSRSMTDKFKTARDAANELFHNLNPGDESFLVTISDRAELRQKFTSNLADVENALVFTHPNGTTSLVDGVYLALAQMKKAHNPRKALIVVSDGGDNNSRYTLRELIDRAVEADTMIYTIGIFQNPQSVEEAEGPDLLKKLSDSTGGLPYAVQNIKDLCTTMARIGITLHNQYLLGYYPPDNAPGGKYRRIRVEVLVPEGTPRLQIYARTGYYVPQR